MASLAVKILFCLYVGAFLGSTNALSTFYFNKYPEHAVQVRGKIFETFMNSIWVFVLQITWRNQGPRPNHRWLRRNQRYPKSDHWANGTSTGSSCTTSESVKKSSVCSSSTTYSKGSTGTTSVCRINWSPCTSDKYINRSWENRQTPLKCDRPYVLCIDFWYGDIVVLHHVDNNPKAKIYEERILGFWFDFY